VPTKIRLPIGLLLFWTLLTVNISASFGQANDALKSEPILSQKPFFIVDHINLIGNKRTRASIITRELNLRKGDTVFTEKQDSIFTWNTQRVYNTRLFNKVSVSSEPDSGRLRNFNVKMDERWYIIPIPLVSFGDRNINEWIKQRGANINRLNYGLNMEIRNFTGRNDELNITLQEGFTQKYAFFYSVPYVNKKQRTGIIIGASYDNNKDVAYKTGKDTLVYFNSNTETRNRFNASLSFSFRPAYFNTHLFDFDYNLFHISDTIAKLNPNYFGGGQTKLSFFALRYYFVNDTRDVKSYAQKGRVIRFELEKLGLLPWDNINMLFLRASYSGYFKLSKHFFFATMLKVKTSLPLSNQPYIYARGLGYLQDFVRGYELYVVDGPHFILNRNTIRRKLWGTEIKFGKIIPMKEFRNVPVSVYLNAYADWGIVFSNTYTPDNANVLNKPLIGYGMGMDIVTYYDQVLRLEYSFNKFGQSGFYVHFMRDI